MKYTFVIAGHENFDPAMFDTLDDAKIALRDAIQDMIEEGEDVTAYILEAVEQHDVEIVTKPDIKITFLKD